MTIDWNGARQLAHASGLPLPTTRIPIQHTLGTTLAGALRAELQHPPHDSAAMDGYAVSGDAPWQVVGRIAAGGMCRGPLASGQAVEIATGAMVPKGAAAVLPYEHVERVGNMVKGAVEHGGHIRRAGSEIPAGTELVLGSTTVSPTVLALAASTGHDALVVRPRPRVAVIVTGDEVVPAGRPDRGKVRDAIGPMLPGLLSWMGATLTTIEYMKDDQSLLMKALTADADVIVTTGASSAGIGDQLHTALQAVSAEVIVNGVECRPGHPQLLARVGNRYVVGLPGNPLAALVATLTLLEPVVRGLTGHPMTPLARAMMSSGVTSHHAMTRLVPVRLKGAQVTPVGKDRPGMLWGAALADAIAVVPPGWEAGEVGLLHLPIAASSAHVM